MTSNISDANSFDLLLAELRGLRDGMDKVHVKLNMHTRITEARLGEFRAELERINSWTRSDIQDFKDGMQAELVTMRESLRAGVRADLDTVKVQISSGVDAVKAAVLTSQAQVSGLVKRISAFNTTSRVTKNREPSDACGEQDGPNLTGRRRPNVCSRIAGEGETRPHIKVEPRSVQLKMIQPEKPILDEKSEEKVADFSTPDDNTETRRIGTYEMTNRVNKKRRKVSGSACDDQEDQARSQDIVSKRKQSMHNDGLKTHVLSVEVEFADGTADFERGKSSGGETSKMFEQKIASSERNDNRPNALKKVTESDDVPSGRKAIPNSVHPFKPGNSDRQSRIKNFNLKNFERLLSYFFKDDLELIPLVIEDVKKRANGNESKEYCCFLDIVKILKVKANLAENIKILKKTKSVDHFFANYQDLDCFLIPHFAA